MSLEWRRYTKKSSQTDTLGIMNIRILERLAYVPGASSNVTPPLDIPVIPFAARTNSQGNIHKLHIVIFYSTLLVSYTIFEHFAPLGIAISCELSRRRRTAQRNIDGTHALYLGQTGGSVLIPVYMHLIHRREPSHPILSFPDDFSFIIFRRKFWELSSWLASRMIASSARECPHCGKIRSTLTCLQSRYTVHAIILLHASFHVTTLMLDRGLSFISMVYKLDRSLAIGEA